MKDAGADGIDRLAAFLIPLSRSAQNSLELNSSWSPIDQRQPYRRNWLPIIRHDQGHQDDGT